MVTINIIVRMNDTDAAGILYFANQFRMVHEAFETLIESRGLGFSDLMDRYPFLFVIRHAESNYLHPLKVGDALEVSAWVSHMGDTSFTMSYDLKKGSQLVGTSKTVHVTIDKKHGKKISLPEELRQFLNTHLQR